MNCDQRSCLPHLSCWLCGNVTFSERFVQFAFCTWGPQMDLYLTNSLKCIYSSSSHTSLIVTIQGFPTTTVGPTIPDKAVGKIGSS